MKAKGTNEIRLADVPEVISGVTVKEGHSKKGVLEKTKSVK